MESTYFRRGFGLKAEIEGRLASDYHSAVVETLRANDYRLEAGHLVFRLAREFGFCYGVDRAVDYAYETRVKFPERRVYLVGEIIHNPHVNQKLAGMGIRTLMRSEEGEFDFSPISADDVVILPAFGVTIGDFERLRKLGCVLVDTTCGSVLNVWKRVESYARDGFTAIIHGKHYHEETKATASQVMKYSGGRYLVVLNMAEARLVCDYIEGRGAVDALRERFQGSVSPGSISSGICCGSAWPTRRRCSPASPSRSRRRCGAVSHAATETPRWPSTSARSTRSAPPPRSGRTPWSRCWKSRSTSWWW